MSGEWKARRFWKAAEIREAGDGWQVALDGRLVRTPGKLPLILPTADLADAIAAEWDAQAEIIVPHTMPLTRAANSAVERVTPQFEAVALMLAEYGGTDLLSYRAEAPEALVNAQAEAWDPLVDWAATELRAPLRITHGVLPVPQEESSLLKLRAEVMALDVFALTALHDLVTLPGSLILGLAVLRGRLDAEKSHAISRIDEEYQAESWGRDEEADEAAAARLVQMRNAERFWLLSRAV